MAQVQMLNNFIVRMKDKRLVVKAMLFLKLEESGTHISANDLNVLSLFVDAHKLQDVVNIAIDQGFKKSIRSVENSISKLVNLNILKKEGVGLRKISENFLPEISADKLGVTCKIHNLA